VTNPKIDARMRSPTPMFPARDDNVATNPNRTAAQIPIAGGITHTHTVRPCRLMPSAFSNLRIRCSTLGAYRDVEASGSQRRRDRMPQPPSAISRQEPKRGTMLSA
jgi:hypothetical protein